MKIIIENPEKLGKMKGIEVFNIKSQARIEAIEAVESNVKQLARISVYQKLIKHNKLELRLLKQEFMQRYREKLSKTADINIQELQQKLESTVAMALNDLHSIRDFSSVKVAIKKLAEQVINYRNRYQKEAPLLVKQGFLRRACFEESRRLELSEFLGSALSIDNSLAFEQKLDRLLAIDSKHASNDYCKIVSVDNSLSELIQNDHKIRMLTAEHIKRGMSYVKANFIATEIVKYEERYGIGMPLSHLNYLKSVGDYVAHNFAILKKSGFNSKEAHISYYEGADLMNHYDPKIKNPAITKSEAMSVQKESLQKLQNYRTTQNNLSRQPVELQIGLEI